MASQRTTTTTSDKLGTWLDTGAPGEHGALHQQWMGISKTLEAGQRGDPELPQQSVLGDVGSGSQRLPGGLGAGEEV